MNLFSNLIIALIFAFWLVLIPVFSIQNVVSVSLKFFVWQSIPISSGVLISFAVALGFVVGALLNFTKRNPPASKKTARKSKSKSTTFVRDWEKEEKDPIFDWD